MPAGTVIIGAGQGGYQVAASLREYGYAEPVVIVGDEPETPYQRPPLSKAYLLGDMTADRLLLRPDTYYANHKIDLVTGDRATGIDCAAGRVTLASGKSLAYEHLVLATGARNRLLKLEGADLDGVLYLRTLAEAQAIKERLAGANNIVVIGAGFIGLELAAVTSKLGKNVTVIEALPRCMSRAVSSIVGEFYAQAHAQWGVRLLFDTKLQKIDGRDSRVSGVTTADGRTLPADLVLVGIGIEPEVTLAQASGLAVANGIVVDARLATADAKISAIGDCAAYPEPGSGKLIRLESVQNAVDQGKCVAHRITGQPADYSAVPWFWSDQRDLKLQMVGLIAGCDRTALRGDPATRAFSVFCFRGDRLLGIESINKPADHMFGRRLLAAGATLTPEEAADLSFDLKARLSRAEQPAKQTG